MTKQKNSEQEPLSTKAILDNKQIDIIKNWLQSSEGRDSIIEAQRNNADVSRMIQEMNNYDPSLIRRPYTI